MHEVTFTWFHYSPVVTLGSLLPSIQCPSAHRLIQLFKQCLFATLVKQLFLFMNALFTYRGVLISQCWLNGLVDPLSLSDWLEPGNGPGMACMCPLGQLLPRGQSYAHIIIGLAVPTRFTVNLIMSCL